MSSLSLEEKKEALEEAGYTVQEKTDSGGEDAAIYLPNHSVLFLGADNLHEAIPFAYAHLQEKQELEALRGIIREIVQWDERFQHYPQSFIVRAKELIEKVKKD